MTDITTEFGRLGLPQYVDSLIEHGFESWESLECVTEEDFDFLKVKLGHRRIIQKEIARRQGHNGRAGSQPQVDGEGSSRQPGYGGDSGSQGRMKRRYRRHPKPDDNAPRRPYSAYAMFANKVREDLQTENRSFVDLAKLAGQRWQALGSSDKDSWNRSALDAKKAYDAELARYRETDEYKRYSEYLAEFKSKHARRPTPESPGSYRTPPNMERGGGASSSVSHDSVEPAVDGLQPTRLRSQIGRQESLILDLHEWIGREPVKRSLSTLDCSNVPERADFDVSSADNLRHVRVINPFESITLPQVQPYLESFLQRINSVVYVFEPAELTSIFHRVFEASRSLPNQLMSEVCLVLALGVQISDDASEDRMIMWYENGRRYLDDENWRNELWVMRIMVLISAYHAGDRRDIAIDIGQANGFRQGQSQVKDNTRITWFEVWQTVEFLDKCGLSVDCLEELCIAYDQVSWLAIPSSSGALEKSRLCSSDHDIKRITPAALNQLSAILRCISDEQKAKPVPGFGEIVVILKSWAASLPEDLRYSARRPDSTDLPVASFTKLSESQKAAVVSTTRIVLLDLRAKAKKLHLQTMLLGTVILLTLPVLLKVIQGRAEASPEIKATAEEAAFTCIESASDLAELCSGMFRARALPPRAWLPLYFLFSASLVSVIGVLWQRTSGDGEESRSCQSSWCWQRALSAIEAALEIFGYCGTYSKTSLWYWTVLAHLRRWIKQNNLDALPPDSQGVGAFEGFKAAV